MTTINFPTSPILNEEYSFGDKTWIWNGYAWDVKAASNAITAIENTSNTSLYPVMVSAANYPETPKVTTSKFSFNALTGNLTVAGNIISNSSIVWTAGNDGSSSGLDADLLDGQQGVYYTDYNNLSNKPVANIILSGDVTGSANTLLTANSTIISITTTVEPTLFDVTYLKLSSGSMQFVTGEVTFEGNVTFDGNVTTISANNLIIEDNFIYLNNQSININVDFGFVGNYNDGIYRHAGFFRDASDDGIWKVFDQYLPEPDENINIDTNNVSFRLANFAANIVYTNRINVTSSVVVENLNADLLDGENGTYYTNYVNQTNPPSANILLTGDVSGSANALLTANSTVISVDVTIQPNSVTLGTDTTGAYVANILSGNGIAVIGNTGAENTTPNITLSPTGVTAASYGNTTAVATLTVDQWGRLTAAASTPINFNYANVTNGPVANIILTGDVTGSANAVLTSSSTIFSIATTIQPNSVELGTDTTGDYVANLVQGSGVTITSGTGESSTPTIAANVVSVGTFVGAVSNANILSSILTVDGAGSGLDADLLDGQEGSYYANDAAVVHITGTETVTGLKTFSNSVVISTNLTSDALRITQLGTGNALVVEDSTNPDSTPFVVDASGTVIAGSTTALSTANDNGGVVAKISAAGGTTSAFAALGANSTTARFTSSLTLKRTRGTEAAPTTVVSGDYLGRLDFQGHDGTSFVDAALIYAAVDGTPGTNDMPGRLVFATTATGASTPTERVRINSSGNVGIGTTSPTALLHVNGNTLITTNSSTNALRITQLGTGNAFVVEDETSPDTTAFIIDNTGNTYIGTRVNTNNSKLVANGTISESVSGTQYLVASQYDIGTDPNEIPLNGYLGTLAYQDSTAVVVGQLRAQGNAGIGYGIGAGSNVTQITSRTTSVAINSPSGAITLVSAAGNASWQTFSVTNSVVASTDTIIINQKSGTDLYLIHVTAVAANTFNVTFATTGGTTTEQPVFNFAVLKASIV